MIQIKIDDENGRGHEKLEKARRISLVSDMILVDMSTSTGAVKSVNTIDNHVEALINRGVMGNVKNLTLYQSPHGLKPVGFLARRLNYKRILYSSNRR